MEFFDRIKELVHPSSEEQKKVKETKKTVLEALKAIEQELKAKRVGGVLLYSDGKESTLSWDLRERDRPLIPLVRGDLESKAVRVMVNSRAVPVIQFSKVHKGEGGYSWTDWGSVELAPEYRLMRKSASYLDQEFETTNETPQAPKEPTLGQKIRLAMRLAEYKPDGRFERP